MRIFHYRPLVWQDWLPSLFAGVGGLGLAGALGWWVAARGARSPLVVGLLLGAAYLCVKSIVEVVALYLRHRNAGFVVEDEHLTVVDWRGMGERVAWGQILELSQERGRVKLAWSVPRHWRPKIARVGTRDLEDGLELAGEIAARIKPITARGTDADLFHIIDN